MPNDTEVAFAPPKDDDHEGAKEPKYDPKTKERQRVETQRESLIRRFGEDGAKKHPSWPKEPTEPHE